MPLLRFRIHSHIHRIGEIRIHLFIYLKLNDFKLVIDLINPSTSGHLEAQTLQDAHRY
jgi:hypothetical protein